jgi:hypothetical protein
LGGGNGPGCLTPGTGEYTGFLITTEREYFEIRPRGSVSAMALGIVNTGYLNVVGAYTDVDVHGFLDGSYPIDPPGAVLFFATGINHNFTIVGRCDTEDGVTYGYAVTRIGLEMLDFPDAVSAVAWGIDDEETIVGEYTDADGITHGFRRMNDTLETIDFPGGSYDHMSRRFGPSVVGSYIDAQGVTHGFTFVG